MNKKDVAKFKKLIQAERERIIAKLDSIEEAINDRTAGQASGSQG